MKPCDAINIPAHKKHRVGWTTPDEPASGWRCEYRECGPAVPGTARLLSAGRFSPLRAFGKKGVRYRCRDGPKGASHNGT